MDQQQLKRIEASLSRTLTAELSHIELAPDYVGDELTPRLVQCLVNDGVLEPAQSPPTVEQLKQLEDALAAVLDQHSTTAVKHIPELAQRLAETCVVESLNIPRGRPIEELPLLVAPRRERIATQIMCGLLGSSHALEDATQTLRDNGDKLTIPISEAIDNYLVNKSIALADQLLKALKAPEEQS